MRIVLIGALALILSNGAALAQTCPGSATCPQGVQTTASGSPEGIRQGVATTASGNPEGIRQGVSTTADGNPEGLRRPRR